MLYKDIRVNLWVAGGVRSSLPFLSNLSTLVRFFSMVYLCNCSSGPSVLTTPSLTGQGGGSVVICTHIGTKTQRMHYDYTTYH